MYLYAPIVYYRLIDPAHWITREAHNILLPSTAKTIARLDAQTLLAVYWTAPLTAATARTCCTVPICQTTLSLLRPVRQELQPSSTTQNRHSSSETWTRRQLHSSDADLIAGNHQSAGGVRPVDFKGSRAMRSLVAIL